MLTVTTAIIGFLGGFVPTILKLLQSREDHKHELAILEIQAKMQAQGHEEKMEEIKTTSDVKIKELESAADLQEAAALYKTMEITIPGTGPIAGFFNGLLSFYNGTVRPTVTYGFVFFYAVTKYAQYEVLQAANQNTWSNIKELYTEFDQSALILVLSYYFGQRQARWAFGKMIAK